MDEKIKAKIEQIKDSRSGGARVFFEERLNNISDELQATTEKLKAEKSKIQEITSHLWFAVYYRDILKAEFPDEYAILKELYKD